MTRVYGWRSLVAVTPLVILSFVYAPPAAAVVLTTAGFEATGFPATEFLVGPFPQQGWLHDTQQNPPPIESTASIVAGMVPVGGGTQSLRVDRQPGSDRRWAKLVDGQPTGRHIVISWDMAVELTHAPNVLGPFMGVEAYDGIGTIGLFGSLGVDAATGEVLYQLADSGAIAATGDVVNSLEWNHFDMVLDMEDEVYQIYLNHSLLETIGFVDLNLGTGLSQFTDADISTFVAGPGEESMNATGTAWFDNFVIRNSLLAGDFNGDNVVDAADYVVWRNSLGRVGLAEPADGNADGVVDEEDYLIWQAEFGLSSGGALVASPVAVPEPATLILGLVAAGLAQLARCQARRPGGITRRGSQGNPCV